MCTEFGELKFLRQHPAGQPETLQPARLARFCHSVGQHLFTHGLYASIAETGNVQPALVQMRESVANIQAHISALHGLCGLLSRPIESSALPVSLLDLFSEIRQARPLSEYPGFSLVAKDFSTTLPGGHGMLLRLVDWLLGIVFRTDQHRSCLLELQCLGAIGKGIVISGDGVFDSAQYCDTEMLWEAVLILAETMRCPVYKMERQNQWCLFIQLALDCPAQP